MLHIEGIEKTNGWEILSWKLETINTSKPLTYDWLLRSLNYPHCYMFIVLDRVKSDKGMYKLDGIGFYSDPQTKPSVKEYQAPYTIDMEGKDMKHLPRFIHKLKPIVSDIEARMWSDGKWAVR